VILLTVPGEAPRVIAVFGAGLIGSSVVEALVTLTGLRAAELPLSWSGGPAWEGQLGACEEKIAAEIARLEGCSSVQVLWSAGRAGFGAGEPETAIELHRFRSVLALAERLARRPASARTVFHLISSAGGLFEGQRHVGAGALPSPRRPYGRLKQRQEELLLTSDAPLAPRIYRLTSVYGYLRPRQRAGLVSTLLLNGVRQRVSPITGRMSTLRDFVFAGDIAAYLARTLLDDGGEAPAVTRLLAQAKPSSLFEIQTLIESILGHRIYVSYSLDPGNSEDITFSPSALPPGWYPSDLRSSALRIYRDALGSGSAFAPPAERS
jgi:UDP-glucose 4-epimerase